MKKLILLLVFMSITSCSSNPSIKNPAQKMGNTEFIVGSKSVAVTDISYKKELGDFFYNEEAGTSPSKNMSQYQQVSASKNIGFDRKVSYGEIRGLSSAIKGLLINDGYKIVQARPNVSSPEQDDGYFDVIKRIKNGDFNNADYVLFGLLAGFSPNYNVERIQGTDTFMQKSSIGITVDFTLVDTKTFEAISSFIAFGSGSDNYIDGNLSGYRPSLAKTMLQVANSLAIDVSSHLSKQDFYRVDPVLNNLFMDSKKSKQRLDEDGTSLKVLKM